MEQVREMDGYRFAPITGPNHARTKRTSWEADVRGDAAIWMSKKMRGRVKRRGRGSGFVWIEAEAAVIYSCYMSPNSGMEGYVEFIEELVESISTWNTRKLVVLAGDFNAAAEEWGSTHSDARGDALMEMANRRGLQFANDGMEPTFRSAGRESFLDLTWYTDGSTGRVSKWRVLDAESLSDHRDVAFRIDTEDRLG